MTDHASPAPSADDLLKKALQDAFNAGFTVGHEAGRRIRHNTIEAALKALEAPGPTTPLGMPVEDLGLSERSFNCLKRANIATLGDITERCDLDLLAITNFGQKCLDETVAMLATYGLELRKV